jgi:ankyrin repeat protein
VVEYLLSTGVEINPRDRWGATPLDEAKKEDLRNFLIEKGGVKGEGKF